jgi:large subunit ribosomal protein L4
MKVAVYTATGEKKEDKELKLPLFDTPVNPALIHEAVVAQMSSRRLAHAKAKTRGEISGGGKKPYKQKGTGRARSGSIRNPIWTGGGVIFGPTGEQNFKKDMPKKKKRAALISALSTKKEDIVSIESIKTDKTKEFTRVAEKMIGTSKSLFIFPGLTEKDALSSRNVQSVKVCDYRNLNVYDVLNANKLVFVGDALDKTAEFLSK